MSFLLSRRSRKEERKESSIWSNRHELQRSELRRPTTSVRRGCLLSTATRLHDHRSSRWQLSLVSCKSRSTVSLHAFVFFPFSKAICNRTWRVWAFVARSFCFPSVSSVYLFWLNNDVPSAAIAIPDRPFCSCCIFNGGKRRRRKFFFDLIESFSEEIYSIDLIRFFRSSVHQHDHNENKCPRKEKIYRYR